MKILRILTVIIIFLTGCSPWDIKDEQTQEQVMQELVSQAIRKTGTDGIGSLPYWLAAGGFGLYFAGRKIVTTMAKAKADDLATEYVLETSTSASGALSALKDNKRTTQDLTIKRKTHENKNVGKV